jgi:hypothetical protein
MTTLKATVEPGTRGSLPLHYVQGLSVITSATGIADGPASLLIHRTIGAGTERGQSTAGGSGGVSDAS